jgi:chemotaxis protein histidine kinase CheA
LAIGSESIIWLLSEATTNMSIDTDMRRKMAEIGARYIARTLTELGDLERMVRQLPTGGNATLKDIEVLAHRIRGSGAVFGFAKLSDAAGVIEMLAVESAADAARDELRDAQLAEQFAALLQRLISETHAAAAVTPTLKN